MSSPTFPESNRPQTASESSGPAPGPVAAGVLASSDFFFTTRIRDTARALGLTVLVGSGNAELARLLSQETPRLLIIDLDSQSAVLPEVSGWRAQLPDLQVIAFGSHVETELLGRAREAGCQKVLARSRFTTQLAELLQTHLRL